jgi:hypothetical protein
MTCHASLERRWWRAPPSFNAHRLPAAMRTNESNETGSDGSKAAKIMHTLALCRCYASLLLLSLSLFLSPTSDLAGSSPIIILALMDTVDGWRRRRQRRGHSGDSGWRGGDGCLYMYVAMRAETYNIYILRHKPKLTWKILSTTEPRSVSVNTTPSTSKILNNTEMRILNSTEFCSNCLV